VLVKIYRTRAHEYIIEERSGLGGPKIAASKEELKKILENAGASSDLVARVIEHLDHPHTSETTIGVSRMP
jgi:hypothetical protein